MDIKILIATHKQCWIPKDEIYLPVQVGSYGRQSIGFQRDDQGNNISEKNNLYSELTALYWGWKNLHCDYIGLVQYRRYFGGSTSFLDHNIMRGQELENILYHSDIVLPNPRNYRIMTIKKHFEQYDFSLPDDIVELENAISAISSDYVDSFHRVMGRKKGHMCNMFIMRKDLCDQFCSWCFSVLDDYENRIDTRRNRIIGYAGEHLLDIWIEKNRQPYVECPMVLLDKKNDFKKKMDFLSRSMHLRHRFIKL